MSWAGHRPTPLLTAEQSTLDTLGRSRLMTLRRWAWLIGLSDEADRQLLIRAKSYATPPSIQSSGARLDMQAYSLERRAIRLSVSDREVTITIKPETPWANPVFEFTRAPRGGVQVVLAGQRLEASRYAWDGQTLWLDATIATPADLRITFLEP